MWRAARGLFVLLFVAPLVTYSGDDAIAALRARLRNRGYTAEVTGGPMIALWSDDAPGARALPLPRAEPGAYLVMTDAGDWWVWTNGLDQGPLAEPTTLPAD